MKLWNNPIDFYNYAHYNKCISSRYLRDNHRTGFAVFVLIVKTLMKSVVLKWDSHREICRCEIKNRLWKENWNRSCNETKSNMKIENFTISWLDFYWVSVFILMIVYCKRLLIYLILNTLSFHTNNCNYFTDFIIRMSFHK